MKSSTAIVTGWALIGVSSMAGHHIGPLENLQVVIERDGAHGDGESDQSKGNRPGGDAQHGGKQIELGPEADERRNPGEREEEHQQHSRQQRIALVQAKEGVEPVAAGGALDDGDDAECADGGQAVGEDVVENGVQ